jgi:hypothetical protein
VFTNDKRKLPRNRHRDLALALFGPECGDAVSNVLSAKPRGVAAAKSRKEQYI